MSKQQYVCGFLFQNWGKTVVLIEKQKPDWQRGKLNGVGGKIEPGETAVGAMNREFEEETGMFVPRFSWTEFANASFEKGDVSFFKAFDPLNRFGIPKKVEVEKPMWFKVSDLSTSEIVIPNLKWLIPMALFEDSPGIFKIIS